MRRFEPIVAVFVFSLLIGCCPCDSAAPASGALPRQYTYEKVSSFPHDPEAFTQGLLWDGGYLYESTGLNGHSSLRRVKLETGELLQNRTVDDSFFAEGLALDGGRLVQLTWKSQRALVYDRQSFEPRENFSYIGEGWGLTFDGSRFIMSNGTDKLLFMDRSTFKVTGSITVKDGTKTVSRLNELEYVDGTIYANVWQTDRIAIINPTNGQINGWVDLRGLLTKQDTGNSTPDVLNGIAYDAVAKRLFVTGKNWPKLYEIRLVEQPVKAGS